MTYDAARESEQLRVNDAAINRFINRYVNRNLPAVQRKTVFFFPGGMASQLLRATTPYDAANPAATFAFDKVWLTWDTFLQNQSFLLKMRKLPGDLFRDKDDRIIVAEGAVELAGISPYSGFIAWCNANGIDCFVVGWDWRRRMADSETFFLDTFLPHFLARVQAAAGNANPLGTIYLVGHSAGGMLVNRILRSGNPAVATFKSVITVGAPFYGYAGQLHRWTEGEPLLNGPGDIFRPKIIRVLTSFPGCYAWHFADEATFNNDGVALAADALFAINAYPSLDDTTLVPADPYHPATQFGGLFRRYPPAWLTGFDDEELAVAGNEVSWLATSLPPTTLALKFFNIRGVQPVDDTVGSVRWKFMKPLYVQLARPCLLQEPIIDGPMVPGDGVQPAYSARLASLPASQVRTVSRPGIDHMFMMNHPDVLAELRILIP